MKWEEYNPQPMREECKMQTEVECPVCGKRLWKRLDILLTSNPPKYQYECDCGWIGYNY